MSTDLSGVPSALREQILRHLTYSQGKDPAHAQLRDWRLAVSRAVRDRIVDAWFAATRKTYATGAKRVYYLSLEFLIGRLLEDAVVNLQLEPAVAGALEELGVSWEAVIADEPDAALGNGGLGRLAACFMDSLATIGCPAYGYGIRYEHGLFRQRIIDRRQVEEPEDWLMQPNPWEFERPESRYDIGFCGHVEGADWRPADVVIAEAFDTPVVGWRGRWANTLRLWSARPAQVFDLARFNRGDLAGAAEREAMARSISRVLYPDDTTEAGRELRLRQEYFFTAASLRDLLRRFDDEHGRSADLPSKVAIQLNDTHPAIAGPEMVRLLHDERGVDFDDACAIAEGCLGYTNHTLLPEALETWPEPLMRRLLPRHMEIIARIDERHARAHPQRNVRILQDGAVHMGPLAFVMAHKVNGVSALHTRLMASTVFADLACLHPGRIVNETNGVTPRRWLLSCNPRLAGLVTEALGGLGWVDDLERLEGLEPLLADAAFLERFGAAKRSNKAGLADWLKAECGVDADPEMMFDVQIKRIHEYKRQHLNVLETIALWQAMRDAPDAGWTPRLKIFAGKAAPGYVFAKEIIELINTVAQRINADAATRHLLQVVFVPNYNVTLAERLIPAADLSEQISTAGKEASGTGNMKFALNGAPTVGTLDGANVEIRERVGAENFFLFGLTAEEAEARRAVPGHAAEAIAVEPRLERALRTLEDGTFMPDWPDRFAGIARNLRASDYFLVCSDFADYWRAQRAADAAFRDRGRWQAMAAANTARTGWFSSDRTIRGYMADIWQAEGLLG